MPLFFRQRLTKIIVSFSLMNEWFRLLDMIVGEERSSRVSLPIVWLRLSLDGKLTLPLSTLRRNLFCARLISNLLIDVAYTGLWFAEMLATVKIRLMSAKTRATAFW